MRPSQPAIAPPPRSSILLALIVCAVAVAALGFASFSRHWLQSGIVDYGVGLRTAQVCDENGCDEQSNRAFADEMAREVAMNEASSACLEPKFVACEGTIDIQLCHDEAVKACATPKTGRAGTFVTTGWITSVAIWLSILGLLAGVGLALARSELVLIAPTTVAFLGLVVALICGCVFVATKPGSTGDFGVGWTFWIFAGGTVAGLLGAMLLARALRPAVGDWDPGDDESEEPPAWDALTPPPGPPPAPPA